MSDGPGKGDRPRITDRKRYRENFDRIDWNDGNRIETNPGEPQEHHGGTDSENHIPDPSGS
jgi:hypothetical protein